MIVATIVVELMVYVEQLMIDLVEQKLELELVNESIKYRPINLCYCIQFKNE